MHLFGVAPNSQINFFREFNSSLESSNVNFQNIDVFGGAMLHNETFALALEPSISGE
jgi:hypothetical protein